MSPNDAEALRRAARPHIGGQIFIGNDAIDNVLHEFVGIRMRIFHSDPEQEANPISFWNIETGDDANILIPAMLQNMVNGKFTIDLDAILRPVNEINGELKYPQLEPFLYKIVNR